MGVSCVLSTRYGGERAREFGLLELSAHFLRIIEDTIHPSTTNHHRQCQTPVLCKHAPGASLATHWSPLRMLDEQVERRLPAKRGGCLHRDAACDGKTRGRSGC